MTFKDDLKTALEDAKAERADQEQRSRDFEAAWYELRQAQILPLFREACEACQGILDSASASFQNGSVVLEVAGGQSMRFGLDREGRRVTYSSSLGGDEQEHFDLAGLSPAVVEAKVKRFLVAVAGDGVPRNPALGWKR